MSLARRFSTGAFVASLAALPCFGAATLTILNFDGAGEGFNDPTLVAPVGGNPGTTLGQQRLNVFQAAANVWGATLTSVPAVLVLAQFNPLTCTAGGAILGAAGPRVFFREAAGTVLSPANTWFHGALANKLSGADIFTPALDTAGGGGAEIGGHVQQQPRGRRRRRRCGLRIHVLHGT